MAKKITYVIFDGDNDKWAYGFMKGWNALPTVDFEFHDAHATDSMTANAQNEEYVKRNLRARFKGTHQVVVLIGEKTKNLYRYVRWEIETAIEMDLPIIAVNLNGRRNMDDEFCPAILRNPNAVHVSFQLNIIKYALENFPHFYHNSVDKSKASQFHYSDATYKSLGL